MESAGKEEKRDLVSTSENLSAPLAPFWISSGIKTHLGLFCALLYSLPSAERTSTVIYKSQSPLMCCFASRSHRIGFRSRLFRGFVGISMHVNPIYTYVDGCTWKFLAFMVIEKTFLLHFVFDYVLSCLSVVAIRILIYQPAISAQDSGKSQNFFKTHDLSLRRFRNLSRVI